MIYPDEEVLLSESTHTNELDAQNLYLEPNTYLYNKQGSSFKIGFNSFYPSVVYFIIPFRDGLTNQGINEVNSVVFSFLRLLLYPFHSFI